MKTRVLIALAAAPLGLAAIWLGLARAQEPAPPPKPKPDHFARLRRSWEGRAHDLDFQAKKLIARADQIAINRGLPRPDQPLETVPLNLEPIPLRFNIFLDGPESDPSAEQWIERFRSLARLCQVEADAFRRASRGDYKVMAELETLRMRHDRDITMRQIQQIDQELRHLERPRQWVD